MLDNNDWNRNILIKAKKAYFTERQLNDSLVFLRIGK